MAATRWSNISDESKRDSSRFEGRADCVTWLAERLDETARMTARDEYPSNAQSFDDRLDLAADGQPALVAGRGWLAAALVAAGLLILHLIVG